MAPERPLVSWVVMTVPSCLLAIPLFRKVWPEMNAFTSTEDDEQGEVALYFPYLLIVAALIPAVMDVTERIRRWHNPVEQYDQPRLSQKNNATKLLRRMDEDSAREASSGNRDEALREQENTPDQEAILAMPHEIKNVIIPCRNDSSVSSISSSTAAVAGDKKKGAADDTHQGGAGFKVPKDSTWGIGLDDSKIQRKMLSRILLKTGIPKSRQLILGKTPAEVEKFSSSVLSLVQKHKTAKFLIIVDEILDYHNNSSSTSSSNSSLDTSSDYISGSLTMKKVLDRLTRDQKRRVCAVVRSANDTQEDVQRSLQRTHGFISKCRVQHDQERESLAAVWRSRFNKEDEVASLVETELSSSESDGSGMVSREELLESLESVELLLERTPIHEFDDKSWPKLWAALHSLKGDVSMVEGVDVLDQVVVLIHDLRGKQLPSDLSPKWNDIQRLVRSGAQGLSSKATTTTIST